MFIADFYSHLVSLVYERGLERGNVLVFSIKLYQILMDIHATLSTICTVQLQSLIGLLFQKAPQRLEKSGALKANCNVKLHHV